MPKSHRVTAAFAPKDQNPDLIVPPQQERSLASLLRILGAAEIVLRDEGVEAFSISRISELSGVSVGGIYRRVKGKAELLQAVKDAAIGRVEESVDSAFDGRRFDDFESLVRAMVGALLASFVKDQALHQILFSTGDSDPVMSARGLRGRVEMRDRFIAAALPIFGPDTPSKAKMIAGVCYDLVTSAIISKVRAPQSQMSLSWGVFAEEMILAGSAYMTAARARHLALPT